MLSLIVLSRFVNENGVVLYHENIEPGLNGFWVEARDLREGDVFLGANGELLTLVSQERVEFEENITVYNFTVDGNHNYFVIAAEDEFGQTCILVHNADDKYGRPPDLPKLFPNTLPIDIQKIADSLGIPRSNVSAQIGIAYEEKDNLKAARDALNDPSRWTPRKFFNVVGEAPQGVGFPGAEIKVELPIGNNGVSIFGGYGSTFDGQKKQGWGGVGRRW